MGTASAHQDRGLGVDEIVRLARSGDTAAAGEYLGRECLPYLMGAARNIAPYASSAEHEDMVQDAILKLLLLWDRGEGPETDPRQYLVAIMKNSHISALRSPRSQVRQFDDLASDDQLTVTDDHRLRQVELYAEAALVRAAFEHLNPRHQRLLAAVLIDGRKPAELVGELGESAPAISNSLSRAKHALRRATLIEALSTGEDRCARNAQRLPERVHADFAEHSMSERGLSHVRRCQGCQSNWTRFGTLTSALGIVPLFVTAHMLASPSAATAVTQEPPTQLQRSVQNSVSGSGSRFTAFTHPWVLNVGITVVAIGGAMIAGSFIVEHFTNPAAGADVATVMSQHADESQPGSPQDGREDYRTRFDVSTVSSGSTASISVGFAVMDSPDWRVTELRFSLPRDTELVAPHGWACEAMPAGGSCFPDSAHPAATDFAVVSNDERPVTGTFSLSLNAVSEATFMRGRAEGAF